MGSVAITNTFTNDTTAEAPQVNTNFSDLVNYINARNSGSSKWDALGVSGNAVIDGTLSVSGTDFATALSTAISADGWTEAGEIWTYASATTFTISGDKTAKYSVGDKIKFVQTTQKYFYITGISYSSPNTIMTVCAGNVYSISNATITVPYYSKMATPNGFPGLFSLTENYITGFSGTPTASISFSINERIVTFKISMSGTSNSTQTIIGLLGNMPLVNSGSIYMPVPNAIDNSAQIGTAIASNSTDTIVFFKSITSLNWTTSGTKAVYCMYQTYI